MKKILIVLIIAFALLPAGCMGTTSTDPIIGNWQDNLLGMSVMEFAGNNSYHASVGNVSYSGTWSKINDTWYHLEYVEKDSGEKYTNTVIYDKAQDTIYSQFKPDIRYIKIVDHIVGNWLDTSHGASLMSFSNDNKYTVQIGNVSFNGTWQKYNDTYYLVEYTMLNNASSIYREYVIYDISNNSICFRSVPDIAYSRHM